MTRWEYTRIPVRGSGELNLAQLNELGRDGWELVNVDHSSILTLKREARILSLPPRKNGENLARILCHECGGTNNPDCVLCRGYGWVVKR